MNPRGTLFFLNSESRHLSEKNFTVVIPRPTAEAAGLNDLEAVAGRYDGRAIVVKGVVTQYNGKPQIVVQSTEEIRLSKE